MHHCNTTSGRSEDAGSHAQRRSSRVVGITASWCASHVRQDTKKEKEEKAVNIKKKVEAKKQKATSNKVEGEDSTSKNIQAKEEAQVNLDDILKSGEQAPEEIKLEGEAPNVDEQLNKVISQGDIVSMEAYQA